MIRALLILLPLIAFPSHADGFDFEVLLNGKPIGHHQIRLSVDQTGRQIVQGDADYTVKLLGIVKPGRAIASNLWSPAPKPMASLSNSR